jgi:hypothetical protein
MPRPAINATDNATAHLDDVMPCSVSEVAVLAIVVVPFAARFVQSAKMMAAYRLERVKVPAVYSKFEATTPNNVATGRTDGPHLSDTRLFQSITAVGPGED